jgi:hypothetical protein
MLAADLGWISSSQTIPEGITVQAVEEAYPEVFQYAWDLAMGGVGSAKEDQRMNKIIPSEVLGIEIGLQGSNGWSSHCYRGYFHSQTESLFPRSPEVGRPGAESLLVQRPGR